MRLRRGCGWESQDTKPVMELMEDTLSNSVQMTEVRACLAESMAAEMEQLMRMYVEPLKVKRGAEEDRPRGDRGVRCGRSLSAPGCGG